MINISFRCLCASYMTFCRKVSSRWNKYLLFKGCFGSLLVPLFVFATMGLPELAVAGEQNQNQSTLRVLFEKLKMKRQAVGGVVLRGNPDDLTTGPGFLDLMKSDFFTVFPGTSRVLLMWNSTPSQTWQISFAGQNVRVQGGQVELQIPNLDDQGIYSWSLRTADKGGEEVMGSWFYLQNIDTAEAQEMLDLVGRTSPAEISDQAMVKEVCAWMRTEALVHQNQYCMDKPAGVIQ